MNILRTVKICSVLDGYKLNRDEAIFFKFLESLDCGKYSYNYFYYINNTSHISFNCVVKCNDNFFIYDFKYIQDNLISYLSISMDEFSCFVIDIYRKYTGNHITVGTNMEFEIW